MKQIVSKFQLEFVYSKIVDSGPHLLGAARCAGPARQRAVATWLPHAARLMRALRRHRDTVPRVSTAHLALADCLPRSPCRRRRRQCSPRHARPSPDRVAHARPSPRPTAPTSPRPPVSQPPRPRRRHPDSRLARTARLPTASHRARPSPRPRHPSLDRLTDRAAVPTASPTPPLS
jgi:hypothetical protein